MRIQAVAVVVLAASVLGACDKPKAGRWGGDPVVAADARSSAGRWQMVPVTPGQVTPGGSYGKERAAVWRLDSQTGALQLCYFSQTIPDTAAVVVCGPAQPAPS